MPKKTLFVLIATAIIIIAAISLQIKRSFFDSQITTPAPILSPSIPLEPSQPINATTTPPTATLSEEQKNTLEEYLKLNLSLLSPVPEVLGGKFYLTEFIIKDHETADIAYEDGHISLEATIKFKITEILPQITSFTVTKENGQPYTAPNNIVTSSSTSTLPIE